MESKRRELKELRVDKKKMCMRVILERNLQIVSTLIHSFLPYSKIKEGRGEKS